jgi:hypothetical protein
MKLSELQMREISRLNREMKFGNPLERDVHVDAVLSGVSIRYSNEEMIADQVMPVIPVKKESDKYYTYTRAWRLPQSQRAAGAEANEVEWNVDTDTYSTEEYALKDLIPDRVRDNADNPLDMDVDTTENLTELITLGREKRVADVAFAAGTYGTQTSALAGANRWDDYAGSDPIGDVRDAKATVHAASGKMPNVMVVGYQVHLKLLDHPDILERIKYTQKGIITADILAAVFEVDRYLIGKALYDSSQEGGTESLGYVWGKNVALLYAEPSPGLKKVSFGYQFQSRGFRTKKWREEGRDGDFIEAGEVKDEKVVAASCGYLYTTVIS